MNIIFTMTLSGSILFILLIIIEFMMNKPFSQRYRYGLLKVALFLHIIPIGYLFSIFEKCISHYHFTKPVTTILIKENTPAIMVSPDEFHVNTAYKNHFIILCIWLIIMFLVILHSLYRCIRFKKYILKATHQIISTDILNIRDSYQSQLKIRHKIPVYYTKANVSPFSFGFIKPVIVLPEMNNDFDIETSIYHELCHIKHMDGLILFLRVVVKGIFWFNPITHLLCSALENASEFTCDEIITKKMDAAEKKQYCQMIINMAHRRYSYHNPQINTFSNNKKAIKERIHLIMKKKQKTTGLAILVSLGMLLCSAIPAFAYEQPKKVTFESTPQDDIFLDNSHISIEIADANAENEFFLIEENEIHYDSEFVDSNGNYYQVDSSSIQKSCSHSYIDGTYKQHNKRSDGSCILKIYNAKRCSKCNTIQIGNLISETKYPSCPH